MTNQSTTTRTWAQSIHGWILRLVKPPPRLVLRVTYDGQASTGNTVSAHVNAVET